MKKINISIRKAVANDAEEMAQLFMRAWQISMKHFVPDGFVDQFQIEIQKEKYASRATDPQWTLLVAQYNDKIIGMIGAVNDNTERSFYQREIKSMYVDPDFQKQGIGKLLIEKLFLDLKKQQVQSAMLWCIKANQPACSFYEKHGGQKIENIPPPEEYSTMPHVIYAWKTLP